MSLPRPPYILTPSGAWIGRWLSLVFVRRQGRIHAVHSFVLDLQPLVADLETIHLLNGTFRGDHRIVRHKT